ncbi:MAG: sulfide/dihydroorotate dehydrogenase-like FAD/NAD-binding protein [Promethearchaeota archaeon]|nr:MAG: sulfide/dihydroorotate dehydrogenase-like FAD/NAD-binding protein [Candidatus Lokiarchaeota archaeon]
MAYKILKKEQLGTSGNLFEMVLETPLIANKAFAGNFILLRIDEKGERFPLTIADYDSEKGTITIVVQVVGKSTKHLSLLKKGDMISDVVGPLGNKIRVKRYKNPIIIIGGGVGIAPCYSQAKELKKLGNTIYSILGAKNTDQIFWRAKFGQVSDRLIITTDDGTEGIKGFVTSPLKDIINKEKISLVIAIGPLIMMKNVTLTTNGKNGLPYVETIVSLNTIMLDGTGMCGGCRFPTIDGVFHFACVEGPDVNGHTVDFDNLMKRSIRYRTQEKISYDRFKSHCQRVTKLKELQK